VVKEFTDKLGNIVLKRVYLSGSEYLDTYYVYDEMNNLRLVLPPEAIKNFDTNYSINPEQFLDNWVFQYKYDKRKLMTHKKVPGADTVYMVYDDRDRLILTQDGNQRNPIYGGTGKDWSFTKYDTLNRPILTGIFSHTSVLNQPAMQSYVNGQFDLSDTYFTEKRGVAVHGYTNQAFPKISDESKYLTVAYYDNYDFIDAQPGVWGIDFDFIENYADFDVPKLTVARGQVTGTKTKILDKNVWIKSLTYYDRKYRVIQSVNSNHLGGFDRYFSKYDFTGKVLKNKTIHSMPGEKPKYLEDEFTFDHGSRQIDQYSTTGEAVTWTDKVGVNELSNGDLINTATSGWGNSGAATINKIPAGKNGWIEMRGVKANVRTMVGLSTTNINAHYNTIEFAIYLSSTKVQVYESGSLKKSYDNWEEGNIFRVERVGNNILYRHNGKLIYTSTKTDDGDLIGDISIYYNGAGIHEVYMSTSGNMLLSHNEYNEIGELVDKNLHSSDYGINFMQSIDYEYNIKGWLKNINHSDLSPHDIGDPNDFFGMELGYQENIGTGANLQYNGNISSIKWSNFGGWDEIGERAYNYGYDNVNRLISASHKIKTAAWADAGNVLKVNNISYDNNGNIKSLDRYDLWAGDMDRMTYNYGTGISQSNRLLRVSDSGNSQQGFIDGNTAGDDYLYDANGNMNEDKNKGIQYIWYNHMNLPDSLDMGDGKAIKYSYDAAGIKLQQRIYEGGQIVKQTDYIGGMIYEDNKLQLIQHAEGRVVPVYENGIGNPAHFVYDYHLKDHLGNVRLTFTTEPGEDTYAAILENATQTQEEADFHPSYDNITRVNASIYDHTDNGTSNYSLLVDGQPGRIIGLAKSMQVLPGDTVTMEVFGKYLAPTTTNNDLAAGMAPAITGAFGLTASATGELLLAYNSLLGLFASGPIIGAGDWEDDDAPKAYLNYILFDKNFVAYDMGIDQINIEALENGTDIPHDHMYLEAYVTKPGYVYIYLSNENPKQQEVYFDDLTIVHKHTPVIQTDDYYPFGLTIAGLSGRTENKVKNKFKYNGKELQDDLDLDWYDYGARMYDASIGRFMVTDRFSEKYYDFSPYQYGANNPVLYVDVNGDSIRINKGSRNLTYMVNEDGSSSITDENGQEYNGKRITKGKKAGQYKGFVGRAQKALDDVREGGETGNKVVSSLHDSKFHDVIIKSGSNSFNAEGNNWTISWNPNTKMGGLDETGNTSRPSFIGLAHELGHAYDALDGDMASGECLELVANQLVMRKNMLCILKI
jgi:RHS repeat-associated protein